MKRSKPFLLYFLLFLILFLSIGAVFGGGALIIDPSGDLLQIPVSMLQYSPFVNFFIPGLILFTLLGIFPALIFCGMIKKPNWKLAEKINLYKDQHWAWTFSYYTGIILILWIDFQVMFLREPHILHLIYSLLGVLIVVVAFHPSIKKYYEK